MLRAVPIMTDLRQAREANMSLTLDGRQSTPCNQPPLMVMSLKPSTSTHIAYLVKVEMLKVQVELECIGSPVVWVT